MKPPQHAERWLKCRRPVQAPRVRLLCLPYAGGGATVFHAWPDELPPDVEVRVLQLPGRQDRIGEAPISSVEAILEEVIAALTALPPAPLVLYGHSFGGLLAFELARPERRGALPPVELVMIGARRAPHLPVRLPDIHGLPPLELVEELHRRYGMPRAVIELPELLELILPSLRADLTASETPGFVPGEPLPDKLLDVPLVLFHGRQDASLEAAEITAWRELCAAPFELREVDAGHFFVDTHRAWLVREVAQLLSRVRPAR